jgi:hypothetical protein
MQGQGFLQGSPALLKACRSFAFRKRSAGVVQSAKPLLRPHGKSSGT